MNRKINLLKFIPLFGTIILLFILFIKDIKKNDGWDLSKKFFKFFWITGLLGSIGIICSVIIVALIVKIMGISRLKEYGIIISFIIGGYLMNIYPFKKYDELMLI